MRFLNAGDCGLIIEFGNEISESMNLSVKVLTDKLDAARFDAILDLTPTYRSLLITFNPLKISAKDLELFAKDAMKDFSPSHQDGQKEIVKIPVLYGGKMGPDLDFIAQHTSLQTQEVIEKHCSVKYLIYMIGFTPGFPYLGGMPKELTTPRLKSPRKAIPAGSVGIAGGQTGIYPVESPGGWQILGRTPLKLFDYFRKNPFLLKAGQYLEFYPINQKEFDSISLKQS